MACRRTQPSNCSREAKCTLHTTLTAHKVQATAQTVQCRRTQPSNCSRTACKAKCTLKRHCTHCTQSTSCTMLVDSALIPQTALCSFWQCTQSTVYSVHCILHGVVHYTIHNGHCTVHTVCTMPSDAVLSCSSAANIMLAT